MLVVELLEHVGLELAVVVADGLDDLLALRRDAASTRSAICAGCSLASLGWGMRRRTVGTWPTNGSTLAQSRNSPAASFGPRARHEPSDHATRAGRPPHHPPPAIEQRELDLVSHDQSCPLDVDELAIEPRPFFSRTSSGRRSNRPRSSLALLSRTSPVAMSATCSAGT